MSEVVTTDLLVRVVPNSGRSMCLGQMDDGVTWKIKLAAPAVDGKANAALIEYMADLCGVSKSRVALISGDKSRQKRLRITGLDFETVCAKLTPAIP